MYTRVIYFNLTLNNCVLTFSLPLYLCVWVCLIYAYNMTFYGVWDQCCVGLGNPDSLSINYLIGTPPAVTHGSLSHI